MKISSTMSIAGLVVAVIVLLGAGTSHAGDIQLNLKGIQTPMHLSSGNSGVVGSVQDSGKHDPPPPPPDTTGRAAKDSAAKAHEDSVRNANHVRDSLAHLKQDSINKANHVRDSINHARQDSINKANHGGDHGRDSTNKAREDSLRASGHKRDSVNHTRVDSLKKEAHVRDSANHARVDSLHRIGHTRDSIIHHRIDSLIKTRHDSTHHGIFFGEQDQNNGMSKSTLSDVVPGDVVLSQNYPNPFGGSENSTAIDFTLPVSQQVTIGVFNAAGQYISTLVNGNLSAGAHSVTFNASNLPTGIYFYKIVTDAGTMTKRMIKVH